MIGSVSNRNAKKLTITNADAVFSELTERVLALESFGGNDPLSTKIAVARVKR